MRENPLYLTIALATITGLATGCKFTNDAASIGNKVAGPPGPGGRFFITYECAWCGPSLQSFLDLCAEFKPRGINCIIQVSGDEKAVIDKYALDPRKIAINSVNTVAMANTAHVPGVPALIVVSRDNILTGIKSGAPLVGDNKENYRELFNRILPPPAIPTPTKPPVKRNEFREFTSQANHRPDISASGNKSIGYN